MNRNIFREKLESDLKLSPSERKYIIETSTAKHGYKIKSLVAMQEFAELIQEISKLNLGYTDTIGLLEEMADAYICLDMIKIIYKIDEKDLRKAMDIKLQRQKIRDNI